MVSQAAFRRIAEQLCIALAIVAAVIYPIPGLFLAVLLIVVRSRHAQLLTGVLTIATITFILGSLNASKQLSGDWVWYSQHYAILEYTPLGSYLGQRIGWITPSPTEPVYYAIARVVSLASGGSETALSWVVTALIYVPLGLAAYIIARRYTRSAISTACAIIMSMLMGLTFTLSTQLVRQEIAAALLTLAIALAATSRPRISVLVGIVAVGTHNSAIIVVGAIAVAAVIIRLRGWVGYALAFFAFFALGLVYLNYFGGNYYEGKSDGEISITTMALDIALLAAFVLLVHPRREGGPALYLLAVAPGLAGFVLGVASQPLPLLRMYFYLEGLRALMVCILVVSLTRLPRTRMLLTIPLVGIAFTYLSLRIHSSPFVYDRGVLEAITGFRGL